MGSMYIDNVTIIFNIRLFLFTRTAVFVVCEFILSTKYQVFTCVVPVFILASYNSLPCKRAVQYAGMFVLFHNELFFNAWEVQRNPNFLLGIMNT